MIFGDIGMIYVAKFLRLLIMPSMHLGLEIRHALIWNRHLQNVTTKANRTMDFVRINIETKRRHMSKAYIDFTHSTLVRKGNNIRIYHECEGRIEQSVPRIAIWHHEACRVMTNGDHEGKIFSNNGFFFLLTTVFYLFIYFKISFQKSLNTLRIALLDVLGLE